MLRHLRYHDSHVRNAVKPVPYFVIVMYHLTLNVNESLNDCTHSGGFKGGVANYIEIRYRHLIIIGTHLGHPSLPYQISTFACRNAVG